MPKDPDRPGAWSSLFRELEASEDEDDGGPVEDGTREIDLQGEADKDVGAALYVVATPIGNLGDVTFRSLEVLRAVDRIACEDTRVTRKLLSKHAISTRTMPFHAHSPESAIEAIVGLLGDGKSVALVSDAGTPLLSDPGAALVEAVAARGFPVVPIPGASALTALLSVAGVRAGRFAFLGFLPRGASEQKALLQPLVPLGLAVVIYESPHRLRETLATLFQVFGPRKVALGKELTKKFERIIRGELGAIELEGTPRGEWAIVVAEVEPTLRADDADPVAVRRLATELLDKGASSKDVAEALVETFSLSKKEAYRIALALKDR